MAKDGRFTVTFMKNIGKNVEQWQITEIATIVRRISRKVGIDIVNGWFYVRDVLAINQDQYDVLKTRYGFSMVYDYPEEER